ncbi:MAG: glutathione S-transferase family protein [Alphaproteobacteria bacterium]
MIKVYSWVTGNSHKVHIMLEEVGLPYELHPINIFTGEQFAPEFLKINPNNKVPVIVDTEFTDGKPIVIFESGMILQYLAEKTGKLLPTEPRARYEVLQWLMFQMAALGPYGGQALHFRQFATQKIPYAIDRYTNEMTRLFRIFEARLAERQYYAGDYSIADIAMFVWVRMEQRLGQSFDDYPNLRRWHDMIAARPAVQKGVSVLTDRAHKGPLNEDMQSVLYGAKQYQPHLTK